MQYQNNTTAEIKAIKLILKESKQALKSLQPIMDKAEKDYKACDEEVNLANDVMVQARHSRDDYQQKLQDARIRLVELESRRDQVKFKKSSGDESVKELRTRQETIVQEIGELQQKKSDLDSNIQSGEQELKTLNAEIQKQRCLIFLLDFH